MNMLKKVADEHLRVLQNSFAIVQIKLNVLQIKLKTKNYLQLYFTQ